MNAAAAAFSCTAPPPPPPLTRARLAVSTPSAAARSPPASCNATNVDTIAWEDISIDQVDHQVYLIRKIFIKFDLD
jgi:hypothetical protein